MQLIVTESFEESSLVAAELMADAVRGADEPLLGLATGGSTVLIYDALARMCAEKKLSFSRAKTINLDEYAGLGRDDPRSYYVYMRRFFDRIDIKDENIFLFDGAADADDEIARAKAFLGDRKTDIQLLGVGQNGHMGFNEPDKRLIDGPHLTQLSDDTRAVNARFFTGGETPRAALTMGMGDIMRSRRQVLIASGEGKAEAVRHILRSDDIDPMWPCSFLKCCPDAVCIIDRALARAAGAR